MIKTIYFNFILEGFIARKYSYFLPNNRTLQSHLRKNYYFCSAEAAG